jgi:hypothetical protein
MFGDRADDSGCWTRTTSDGAPRLARRSRSRTSESFVSIGKPRRIRSLAVSHRGTRLVRPCISTRRRWSTAFSFTSISWT